jgi:DNA-binding transcriptional MerR regulator
MEQDEALRQALQLATDPPVELSVDVLRELARDDDATEWNIATTAAHLGVSPHTLRYYERIGLVRVPRDAAGHRRYDAPAVRRLVFITRMRISGMSISDLHHYVDLADAGQDSVSERMDILLEHRDTLRSQIAQLQLSLAATEYKIATYQEVDQLCRPRPSTTSTAPTTSSVDNTGNPSSRESTDIRARQSSAYSPTSTRP